MHPSVTQHGRASVFIESSCTILMLGPGGILKPLEERIAGKSLWLSHANAQTTEIYTRVGPAIKLEAFDAVIQPN